MHLRTLWVLILDLVLHTVHKNMAPLLAPLDVQEYPENSSD